MGLQSRYNMNRLIKKEKLIKTKERNKEGSRKEARSKEGRKLKSCPYNPFD